MTYPVLLGAIVLTSANNRLRFREAAGAVGNADVAAGTYYMRGDGTASDLLLAIKTALDAFGVAGNAYSVAIVTDINPANKSSAVVVTRTSGADTFGIVVDGSETFDMDLIGFPASTANDANAKTSTVSCAGAWTGNDVLREREPFGSRIVSVPRKVSGGIVGVSRSAHMTSWSIVFAFLHEDRTLLRANPTDTDATLEAFVMRFGAGAAFEGHEVAISSGTVLTSLTTTTRFAALHWSEDTLSTFRPRRIGAGVPLYDLDTIAHEQVT